MKRLVYAKIGLGYIEVESDILDHRAGRNCRGDIKCNQPAANGALIGAAGEDRTLRVAELAFAENRVVFGWKKGDLVCQRATRTQCAKRKRKCEPCSTHVKNLSTLGALGWQGWKEIRNPPVGVLKHTLQMPSRYSTPAISQAGTKLTASAGAGEQPNRGEAQQCRRSRFRDICFDFIKRPAGAVGGRVGNHCIQFATGILAEAVDGVEVRQDSIRELRKQEFVDRSILKIGIEEATVDSALTGHAANGQITENAFA